MTFGRTDTREILELPVIDGQPDEAAARARFMFGAGPLPLVPFIDVPRPADTPGTSGTLARRGARMQSRAHGRRRVSRHPWSLPALTWRQFWMHCRCPFKRIYGQRALPLNPLLIVVAWTLRGRLLKRQTFLTTSKKPKPRSSHCFHNHAP